MGIFFQKIIKLASLEQVNVVFSQKLYLKMKVTSHTVFSSMLPWINWSINLVSSIWVFL